MEANGSDRRAFLLGRFIAGHHDQLAGYAQARHGRLELSQLLGGHDPDLPGALRAEFGYVLDDPEISNLACTADAPALAHAITQRLSGPMAHSRDTLWALLGGDDGIPNPELPWAPQRDRVDPRSSHHPRLRATGQWLRALRPVRWLAGRRGWLARQGAAVLMNLVVALTMVATWAVLWLPGSNPVTVAWPALALKMFALWCLAFLPCWLYLRFLGQRAGALWDEYVLNLHRLGWDQPRFLPRPQRTSHFYDEWVADGGRHQLQDHNIYRQKFNAYYGRSVAENAREDDFKVRLDTLFPVFLTAAVLAVCWSAVLWNDRFLREPTDVWDVIKYGFLGAYVFIVQMLLRRFFGSDLRPSAYTSALLRITVMLVGVAAVYQVLEIWLAGSGEIRRWEAVVAFTIGFFPLVATQVVVRAASVPLRMSARSLDSDYPLSQLDGLNIWYETRLVEENIDDMQNLATANFVDVILHTRVPVGRLVDWVDQAFLFLHLDRVERSVPELRRARARSTDPPTSPSSDLLGASIGPNCRGGTRTRTALRQFGIRTATDLIKAFPLDLIDPFETENREAPVSTGLRGALENAGLACDQIRMLVRVLGEEQGLAPVWNWHDRGVRARCPQRHPRSVRRCPSAPPPVNSVGSSTTVVGNQHNEVSM